MHAATRKALVVEDSPTMRHLIVFALRKLASLTVVEAEDGIEALEKLKKDHYDLLITDINMPLMDGFKLVKLVRDDVMYKDIPIVVITTEGASDDRNRALSLGANAYIPKPIQAAHVTSMMKELLGL